MSKSTIRNGNRNFADTCCPSWCEGRHIGDGYESVSLDGSIQYRYHEESHVDGRISISSEDSLTMTPNGVDFVSTGARAHLESELDEGMTADEVRGLAASLLAAAGRLDAINAAVTT